MRILRSLEEFLYELVGWLVFYPRTFLRIVLRPSVVARYTQLELEMPPERQFMETISPVLMLILSVVLAHALELTFQPGLPEFSTPAAKLLLGSEQGLLLTRCVAFCALALVAALVTLHRQRKAITRETLRSPFSIQAFLVSPFVLFLSAATLMAKSSMPHADLAGGLCSLGAVLWYVWARASAYRELVGGGLTKALAIVVAGFLITCVIVVGLLWVVLGTPGTA